MDDETEKEIRRTVRNMDQTAAFRTGDIRPSERAVVITGENEGLFAETMTWGFPNYSGAGLFINARAETVTEKKTFRESVFCRRCVIPASGYYEWDKSKNKAAFTRMDASALYMAGFYRRINNEDRFMIITTAANDSVKEVHDRMPLILEKAETEDWICRDDLLPLLLKKIPPMLTRYQEYEQQTLSFL